MELFKKSIIIAFFLCLSGEIFAHTPIDLTISESAVYSFRFEPGNDVTLKNHFIKEIARYNYLNLYRTRYFLDYELEVKIIESSSGIFKIESMMNRKQMEGDIFYEKFDLSQVLMPSEYSFDLVIEHGAQHHKIAFSGFETQSNNPPRVLNQGINQEGNTKITVENITFRYAEADKKRFEERILSINEYLAYYELLDVNLRKSLMIDIDDSSAVFVNFIKIFDLKRFYNLLQNNSTTLIIPDQYRFEQVDKETRFESQLRRLNHLLMQNVEISVFDPESAFDSGSAELLQLQSQYLSAMAGTSHLLEPVYMKVLNFFEHHSGWNYFKKEFSEVFSDKFPGQDIQLLAAQFNRKLYEDYMLNAENLLEKESFIEAVIFLNSTKTLCNNLPEFDCELYTFHKLSRAKYGIYDSYLSVAESAQKAGSTSLAYTYLMMARQFQQQNSNLIITSGIVDKSLSRLAWQFVEDGKTFGQADNTAQSLENFVNARDIYSLIGVDDHTEYIDRQIARLLKNEAAGTN